jgi:hypothetical protein
MNDNDMNDGPPAPRSAREYILAQPKAFCRSCHWRGLEAEMNLKRKNSALALSCPICYSTDVQTNIS